jgi:magnesium-transporting ATPase (P-type)
MSHNRLSSSWNSNVFLIIASLLVFEIAGGLYLYLSHSFTVFYQYSLLFHIFIGLFLIIPLAIYLFKHSYDVKDKKNDKIKIIGILSFVVIAITCITGTYQTFVGFEKDSYWISYIHTWVGFVSVLIVVAHILNARLGNKGTKDEEERVASLEPANTFVPKKVLITTSASCLSLFLIISLLAITYRDIEYKNSRTESYTMKYGDNPFHPSEAMTASGDVIDARLMGNSRSCANGGCHGDIYRQWYSSAENRDSDRFSQID